MVGYRSVSEKSAIFCTESIGIWHDRQFLDSIITREDAKGKRRVRRRKEEAEEEEAGEKLDEG